MEDRLQSCLLVGLLKLREAVPVLVSVAAEEGEPKLVWQSLVALGAIGSRRATRPILRLLRSKISNAARRGAILALMQLADARARGTLIQIASDGQEEDYARALATEALGLLKPSRQSSRFLVKALRDPSAGVRFGALCAIGALGDRNALPAVSPLLDDVTLVGDESIADRAALVLGSIQNRP